MSVVAVRLYALAGKRMLEPGTDAGLMELDPNKTDTIATDDKVGVADFSLYQDREVTDKVVKTLFRGSLVVSEVEVVGKP